MTQRQPSKYQGLRVIAEALTKLLILPTLVLYQVQKRLLGKAFAYQSVSQRSAQWSGLLGVYLRRALHKHILAHSGENVSIGVGTILTKQTIELGDSVYIGSYSIIGDTRICKNTLISDHVSILSGNHGIEPDILIKDQPETYRTISIGEDCWIGSRAVILADLGNHCVVGAGSVVTKPVLDYQIVAGNPAKLIKDRRQLKVANQC